MNKSYPSYKPTTIPWLPLMPQHWELIGFNFLFRDNKEKNKGMKESLILSLSYGNIIRKRKEENFGLIPESFETYQVLNPGYIVLRLTDLQNDKRSLRVGYVNERGIITSAYTGLVPNKVNSRYYYYFLHYLDIKKHFYSLGGGVRQSSDYNELKKQKFPFPPLSEQTAIVNYLDAKTEEIVTFIAKKQKLITLLKEQKLAIVSEHLKDNEGKWEQRKLKYVIFFQRGHDLTKDSFMVSGEKYPVYGSNGIIGHHNQFTTKAPCITVGRSGSVGEINFIEEDFWAHNTCLYAIRNYNNNWEFLFYLLKTIDIKSISNGTAVPTLDRKKLHAERVFLPPLKVQVEIVNKINSELSQINTTICNIEKEIELVKVLKQSLVAEVVTGKIKVI